MVNDVIMWLDAGQGMPVECDAVLRHSSGVCRVVSAQLNRPGLCQVCVYMCVFVYVYVSGVCVYVCMCVCV